MTAFKITFQTPEEILDFVSKVEKYDYAMDMKSGRFIVDAKSILGIMNLGLNSVIDLEIHGDDCGQLEQDISRYIAA